MADETDKRYDLFYPADFTEVNLIVTAKAKRSLNILISINLNKKRVTLNDERFSRILNLEAWEIGQSY